MIKLTCIIITIGLFYTAHSQNVRFTWNNVEGREENSGDIFSAKNPWGNFIRVKKMETGEGVFKNRIFAYYLERMNDKMVVQAKNTIPSEDEPNMTPDGNLVLRDKLLLFKTIFKKEKDTVEHYGYVVDSKTLKPLVSRANVAFFTADGGIHDRGMYYSLSPDSSLVLAFAKSVWEKKKDRRYSVNVLDNSLNKVWNIVTELPYPYYFTSVTNYFVTNAGKAGIFIKQFDKDISGELAKDLDGSMKAPYQSKLLMYEKRNPTPQEILLDLKGKYVSSIQLTGEDKSKLTFFGLCKDANNGNVGYFFTVAYDKASGKFDDPQINPFPENLLKLVMQDDQANGKSKDAGIGDNFKLAKVIDRGDGTKDYLLEYNLREEGMMGNYPIYYYNFGDIIDICVQPGNKISIARIPKMQATKDEDEYSSFLALPYKDKLLVFYNDEEKNIKQPIEKQMAKVRNTEHAELVMAVVDKQGNVTRTMIKDKEESVFKNFLADACLISNNKIAFYGAKDSHKMRMLGIMEIE